MLDILTLINRMGEKEHEALSQEFISPIFDNRAVAIRVSGLIYTFSVPRTEPGWYRFKPMTIKRAEIVGEASLSEIESYQRCLGRLRMTLIWRKDNIFYGIPDKVNRYNLCFSDPLPVYLCDDTVMDYDRVFVRFDGTNLWYESLDNYNDPAKADYLREEMQKLTDHVSIRFSGLTFEERLAYVLRLNIDKKLREDMKSRALRVGVEHAGGTFIGFEEKSNRFSVTYEVDGQRYTSQIGKDPNQTVISAGICVSGEDAKFDLKSLITVIREAQDKDAVHRTYME